MTNEIKVTKTNSGWTVECGAWFKSCKTRKSALSFAKIFQSWLDTGIACTTAL